MKYLTAGLLLLYPFLVLLGIGQWSPRVVGIVVIAVYLLQMWGKCSLVWQRLVLTVSALSAGVVLWRINDAVILQLLPAGISLAMAGYFGYGFLSPPGLPGRMAALQHGVAYQDLNPAIQRYTWKVTGLWSVFLLVNAAIGMVLAVYVSQVLWALYTGVLAYLAIAVMFIVEYLYRRLVFYRRHGL